uniref:Uncharacterized protein n=1 Tax=Mycena chlorophos TaxID=658473 RepID=A0ABQ0L9D9_MYCCL|nr:predicted protein [Mycena chlorophos]
MSFADRALRLLQIAVAATFCAPCALLRRRRRRRRRGCVAKPHRIVYPPPLPIERIDISTTSPATPSQDCHILNLPQELRLVILEELLGGHSIELGPLVDGREPCSIRASILKKDLISLPTHLDVAVLHTCRQLYLDGLPILHCKNTYEFQVGTFSQLYLGALGLYCISNIRHISFHIQMHNDEASWERAFDLLRMMQLETLCLFFGPYYPLERLLKLIALDGDWALRLLAIRGLRAFEVKFPEPVWLLFPNLMESERREPEQLQLAKQLVAVYGTLLVGLEAEGKYLAYLKGRSEHGVAAPRGN